MAGNIPAECPTCFLAGQRSSVKLYQISLEEAAVFCENPSCPFPLFSQSVCPLVVPQLASASTPAQSRTNWINRSTDTGSEVSSCSASSWASHASTISNVSSSVATPPPIARKSHNWQTSSTSLVYQPTIPKPKNVFNWASPISSAQSSPASSVFSVTDREVENVMKNCFTPNAGPTPSPSPLLTEMISPKRPRDDIDSFIDSFAFLDDIDSQPLAPTSCVQVPSQDSTSISDLTDLQPPSDSSGEIIQLLGGVPVSNYKATPRRQPAKRKFKETESTETAVTSECNSPMIVTQQTIRKRKPRVKKVAVTTPTIDTTLVQASPAQASPARPSSVAPLILKPQVEVEVNAEGTSVFTIVAAPTPVPTPVPTPTTTPIPVPLPVTPAPPLSPKKKQATRKPRAKKPVVAKEQNPLAIVGEITVGKRPRKTKDPFCIQSLVDRFIQAAKNKKLPESKSPGRTSLS